MITKPTVLILGAGASAPFGFPTGRKLLFEIYNGLSSNNTPLYKLLFRYSATIRMSDFHKKIMIFRDDLRGSMQPSVDAFLENRDEFLEIGKAAIAASLIPYEDPGKLARYDGNMHWYEYLFNNFGAKSDEFVSSELSIITFNYDRSLECFLFGAFQKSYGLNDNESFNLLKTIPIVHFYGQIEDFRLVSGDGHNYSPDVDPPYIKIAADNIKILHEIDEITDEQKMAHKLIESAEKICFLGFGYHKVNMERLKINEIIMNKGKPLPQFYGTGFGLGDDERRRSSISLEGNIKIGNRNVDILTYLQNEPVFE